MSNKNRGDRIQLLHKVVKKHYKPVPAPEGRSVLEHIVYASCLEDARYDAADEAFHRLQESYFDWNEVRVTTVTELSEVLHNLPDPTAAAVRVKKNLQSIFETRYSFDIEDMVKMNQGKAIQELEKLGGITKFVLGYTTQQALSGHAIPISQSIMEILIATEIVTESEASKGNAPGLERTIAKSKGPEFASCLHQFAVDCRSQPSSKQLKAMLKEAGAVEQVKKEEPKPLPKPEKKKAPAVVVAPKPEKAPAVEKPKPTKSAAKTTPKAATGGVSKPVKKSPAKKESPVAKVATKKTPPAKKATKRKPK